MGASQLFKTAYSSGQLFLNFLSLILTAFDQDPAELNFFKAVYILDSIEKNLFLGKNGKIIINKGESSLLVEHFSEKK